MDFTPIAAVAVGSALTYVAQWTTERRVNRRADAKAKADALGQQRAAWRVFQVESIADLQEQLEAIAAMIGVELSERPSRLAKREPKSESRAALTPFGRAAMLTYRLGDETLAADVRLWLRNTREAMNPSTGQADFDALRDRRAGLQERLGVALRAYHPDVP